MAESNDLDLPSMQKLQSAEQMELLDVVDSLRACGLSEIVALPQLIVCGDQSSGKSSVLEAISGIPFPKQDTLCTRFATEVILRRAARVEINVSIVPGEDRTVTDRDRLNQFRRGLKTIDDFGDLFQSARDEMGLSSSGKSFSNDILRVEFCGPSQPQLTLVDLPGLIHSETKSQTTGDVQLVHKLVSRYLDNPRSIILAVVSAKNDIGNQIILRNARKVDPQGLRTLGIITKPDCVKPGSKSEEAFIALARNEDVKFSLGWYMVKNLDSSSIDENQQQKTRDQDEADFFERSGFNRLPAHILGINFLRARLSKVLFSQVRRELPRLVEDIQIQITATRLARDKLGPSRSKPEEQREFLISLSQTFQSICRDAIKGDYDHVFFQDDSNPERRLCANVMNMHFEFANNIRKKGSSWLMGEEDIFSATYRSRSEAIKEACLLLKRSRGRELPGLPNPLLVGELFRLYSRPWGDLARQHITKVWEAVNRFLELLLRHLTDEDVCENITRFWLYPIMEEKLNLAYSKLDDLLEVHKDYPMTTNSLFLSNSKSTRQDSSKKALESMLKDRSHPDKDVSVDEITKMMSAITTKEMDMDMAAAEEAFDNMNAYYEVAMNLFTDNVPTLAIQSPIIREVPKTFCPTAVYMMGSDVVTKIAGESEEKMMERDTILRRLGTLENGARICKQYAKRPQVLNMSSDEVDIVELSVPSPRIPTGSSKKTSRNPSSTAKSVIVATPQACSAPSGFGPTLTPSAGPQPAFGSSNGGLFGAGPPTSLAKKDSDTGSGPFDRRSSHEPFVAEKYNPFARSDTRGFLGATSSATPGGFFGSGTGTPSNSSGSATPVGWFGNHPATPSRTPGSVFGAPSNKPSSGAFSLTSTEPPRKKKSTR
ncbi:hypothetical protein VTL71DRAFT_5977 [Oculimacula yallundae]|uniref:Uncharacterized protein n=1 Tax=Oculimacula yallundae TaxID=86028 RepID=A0ABR4BZ22_9HELO